MLMTDEMCLFLVKINLVFKGRVAHTHLSKAIKAVIQPVVRAKMTCGQPPVMSWISVGTNGKSDSLNTGV